MSLFTPLVPATPGAFRVRCSLLRWVPEKKLTPTELRECKEAGLPRRYFELDSGRRTPGQARKGRWEVGYATCGGFETDDRAAYAEHMKAAHNRGSVQGHSEAFARSVRAGWRSPRTAPDGKALPKTALELLVTCPTCGLQAERAETHTFDLWWREHVAGCALAAAS
jgi:hypothetical protein